MTGQHPAADSQNRDLDPDRDRPVLPDISSDEAAEGWGETPDTPEDDDARLLGEVPPHHLG